MKKFALVFLLIVAVPAVSQISDKWYLLGGIGGYTRVDFDTEPIWHVGAGLQISERFGIELAHWPGFRSLGPNMDDVEVSHTAVTATFRAWRIYRNPDVQFVFKGGTSRVKSINHDEVGTPAVSVSPFIMTAGIVINPQAKRSFEFSVTRSQEKSELSDTLKASLRIRF